MLKSEIKPGTKFNFNGEYFVFGKEVMELKDSSKDIDDFELLKKKIKTDGYLFIRGFHSQDSIDSARNFILRAVNEDGGLKKKAVSKMD
tara:strand:- start:109 stop:375 length:267 start_codon:yes stop_codon:yes gene_type:complete